MTDVFVPGGLPKLTYNPRDEHRLENRLEEVKNNLCKLVMVTGLTKSGKTVLTKKIFPRDKVIWVDGGSFTNEDDFWAEINNQVDGFTEFTATKSTSNTGTLGGGLEGEGGIPFLKAKASGNVEISHSKDDQTSVSRSISSKSAAISSLRKKMIPLIIDDFHYIKREKQGEIIRALKSLIFDGLPVILIAIPHRRLDVVKVEKEMTGRIETISVPSWSIDELKYIPQKGSALLNLEINDNIIKQMADNAYGSPHLMQEFCRELCRESYIIETTAIKTNINNIIILNELFKKIAENTGKVIFEKLRRGPRSRTDRIKRTLKNGKVADIYGVILYALAELRPGIQTLNYEDIRLAIKEITAGALPQAHEISRVLKHMSNISTSDESSTPVIDWEEDDRLLHITDPFFAYYLKWGDHGTVT